jgi:two-component system chemotaxis response regulator CheB
MPTMKVLIVNDSPVQTAIITAVIKTAADLQISGTATNGEEAIERVRDLLPDIVLMDIHMPKMDGVESTRRIMQARPKTRILITSATINRNMKYLFTALQHGALDYVHAPKLSCPPGSEVSETELRTVGAKLLGKIRTLLRINEKRVLESRRVVKEGTTQQPTGCESGGLEERQAPALLAIGCSTGGPQTVAALISALNHPFPAPVLLCQHMDAPFTQGFVSWLGEQTGQPTTIARNGVAPQAGQIYVAPGGKRNLEISPVGLLKITPPREGQIYLPNISHLFSSLASRFGARGCGVVLTGMGDDGASGVAAIHQAGGICYAQDSQSAIIDAMPQAARHALGGAPGYTPQQIALRLNSHFARSSA